MSEVQGLHDFIMRLIELGVDPAELLKVISDGISKTGEAPGDGE